MFADTAIVQAASEGQDAFIRCEATGDPLPKIWWYFKGKALPGRLSMDVEVFQSNVKLFIFHFQTPPRNINRPLTDCTSSRWRRRMQESTIVGRTKTRMWCSTLSRKLFDLTFFVSERIFKNRSFSLLSFLLDAPFFVDDRIVFYGYDLGIANLSCNVMSDPPAVITWSASNPKVPQKCFTVHNDTNSSELEVSESLYHPLTSVIINHIHSRSFLEINEYMESTPVRLGIHWAP